MKDELPISDRTRQGMTLNIDDQKWIKVLFDRQDQFIKDTYDEHAVYIIDAVKELLKEQTKSLDLRFDAIDKRLTSIEAGASDREKRIEYLEKRASLPYMIIRYGFVIAIGIGIGWLLHSVL